MGRFDGYARKSPGSLVMQEAPGCCFILPLRFFGLRLPLLALQDEGGGENLHRQSPFSYIFRGFAFSYTWGSAASMIQYITAEPHLWDSAVHSFLCMFPVPDCQTAGHPFSQFPMG